MKKITIIGGGLSGLAAGYHLSRNGFKVTVLEKEATLGGLAASFQSENGTVPFCYHHVMESDEVTRNMIKDVGLESDFYWTKVKMGFLHNRQVHELKSPIDILFFKPLKFIDRIRFGFFGLRILLIRDWSKYHVIPAKDWIIKYAGRNVYETIFRPLLKTKFGKDSDSISASWVGMRLAMRESSGDFGYLKNGLSTFVDRLAEEIRSNGGNIILNADVKEIEIRDGAVGTLSYESDNVIHKEDTDAVLATLPIPELLKMVNIPDEYKNYENQLRKIRYKATICVVIGLDTKLFEYYWLNLLDLSFSFGGIFDHTNLNHYIDKNSILYLFTYLDPEDELWKMQEEAIVERYLGDLGKVFPDIGNKVKWSRVFKLRYSKPIYEVNYNSYKPEHKTPINGLYLAGIGLIYPDIRNMGSALRSGTDAAKIIGDEITGVDEIKGEGDL